MNTFQTEIPCLMMLVQYFYEYINNGIFLFPKCVIMKELKWQTTFWKWQEQYYSVIIVSMNAANYFEVQSIYMFSGYLEAACKSYHKLPVHDSVSQNGSKALHAPSQIKLVAEHPVGTAQYNRHVGFTQQNKN